MHMYPTLRQYVESLPDDAARIPEARKVDLARLAEYVASVPAAHLVFICTHNSRRSHFAQVWAAAAAHRFGVGEVFTYSGGTETTAVNRRAVAALERAGFQVERADVGDNPRYLVSFAPDAPPVECFSKQYDHPANPKHDFAAVMTCAEADAGCPFIPGAAFRIALAYEDPKAADDTPEEQQRYDERCRQIGAELYYAFSLLK
jgi:arsenate reductase